MRTHVLGFVWSNQVKHLVSTHQLRNLPLLYYYFTTLRKCPVTFAARILHMVVGGFVTHAMARCQARMLQLLSAAASLVHHAPATPAAPALLTVPVHAAAALGGLAASRVAVCECTLPIALLLGCGCDCTCALTLVVNTAPTTRPINVILQMHRRTQCIRL
jgi:hypothetical protein